MQQYVPRPQGYAYTDLHTAHPRRAKEYCYQLSVTGRSISEIVISEYDAYFKDTDKFSNEMVGWDFKNVYGDYSMPNACHGLLKTNTDTFIVNIDTFIDTFIVNIDMFIVLISRKVCMNCVTIIMHT